MASASSRKSLDLIAEHYKLKIVGDLSQIESVVLEVPNLGISNVMTYAVPAVPGKTISLKVKCLSPQGVLRSPEERSRVVSTHLTPNVSTSSVSAKEE